MLNHNAEKVSQKHHYSPLGIDHMLPLPPFFYLNKSTIHFIYFQAIRLQLLNEIINHVSVS